MRIFITLAFAALLGLAGTLAAPQPAEAGSRHFSLHFGPGGIGIYLGPRYRKYLRGYYGPRYKRKYRRKHRRARRYRNRNYYSNYRSRSRSGRRVHNCRQISRSCGGGPDRSSCLARYAC